MPPIKGHSKLTLAILLVVLLCQFFPMGSAFSVQYPSGKHPMGKNVSHHHSHGDSANRPGNYVLITSTSTSNSNSNSNSTSAPYALNPPHSHHHGPLVFNAGQPAPLANDMASVELTIASMSSASGEGEHEHSNHSYTQSHPPCDSIFIASFFQSEILLDDDISYLNCRYAPPIPPPHA
ncbi:hypothetical protein SHVI106290_10285 [Shewanella violacea]|uniref:Uncharacterized protein n=2 Tax=Shewanella violacea TaxID=60217 RepID=D4ZL61_SHEVD|nr:hypothetical protein SVI_2439 [Shewanella violacea DSS12]